MEKKQNIIKALLTFALSGGLFFLHAQPDSINIDSAAAFIKNNTQNVLPVIIVDGDTIAWELLDEILFVPKPTFDNKEARKRYFILKKKVIKVYPYASLTGEKTDSLQLNLDDISKKRKRKKYIKHYQKYLEERFEPELKNLTRSEGQILCKLVYKETGITVFDLIKSYRSGWNAWWWDRLAHLYDIDLKTNYDPDNSPEDKLIDNILTRAFNDGSLEERIPFYPPPKK